MMMFRNNNNISSVLVFLFVIIIATSLNNVVKCADPTVGAISLDELASLLKVDNNETDISTTEEMDQSAPFLEESPSIGDDLKGLESEESSSSSSTVSTTKMMMMMIGSTSALVVTIM